MPYLDHNATTPVLPEVLDAMHPFFAERFANPASLHAAGQQARHAVEVARASVRSLLGATDGDVLFASSGTEAVLTGVIGAARVLSAAREKTAPGRRNHFVTTQVEHTAGLDAAELLEGEGWDVTRVGVDGFGRLDPKEIADALGPETRLVSVMHANNETGVVHPIAAIARLCRERGVLVHTDAVQSAGKVVIEATAWGLDLVSIAAHKLGGPKGAGALWSSPAIRPVGLLPGRQEAGRRGGTLDVPAIVGFGAACESVGSTLARRAEEISRLRDRLESLMAQRVPEARLTGAGADRLSNTSHFTFDDRAGEDLVLGLDLAGYAVSAGSACRSGSPEPSHVLLAMGFPPERARRALRVSLGRGSNQSEIEGLVDAVATLFRRSRALSGGRA